MGAQPEQAFQSGQGVALSDTQPQADRRFQASRLAAVDATELAVGASDGAFERLSRLAALLLDAPLAFVTVVDTTRSWYRTCVGLGPHAERFAAVEASFCRYVVEGDAPLVLDDARADARTRENGTIVDIGIVARWIWSPTERLAVRRGEHTRARRNFVLRLDTCTPVRRRELLAGLGASHERPRGTDYGVRPLGVSSSSAISPPPSPTSRARDCSVTGSHLRFRALILNLERSGVASLRGERRQGPSRRLSPASRS
jgi:hypothetical protein